MIWDDDDREESLSTRGWQNTIEHQKQKEATERKKKQERKQELNKLQLNVLQHQVQPVQPVKEQEKKLPQGTKSRQEEAKEQILEPNTEVQIDTVVEQGRVEEERKDQSPYERQKNAG